MAQIKLQFAKDDFLAAEEGHARHDDFTPSGFLVAALDIENTQSVFYFPTVIRTHWFLPQIQPPY